MGSSQTFRGGRVPNGLCRARPACNGSASSRIAPGQPVKVLLNLTGLPATDAARDSVRPRQAAFSNPSPDRAPADTVDVDEVCQGECGLEPRGVGVYHGSLA